MSAKVPSSGRRDRPPEVATSPKRESDRAGLCVLQVVPSVGISEGGLAVVVVELSDALQRADVGVQIFTTDSAIPGRSGQPRRSIAETDLPYGAENLDIRYFQARRPYRLLYAPDMARALNDSVSSFDLVHIHGIWSYCARASWRAARRAGVPVVVSTHGMLDPFLLARGRAQKFIALNEWIRPMLRGAAAIHCTAEPEREQISSFAPDTPRAVIPNGFHLDRLALATDPGSFRREMGIGESTAIVLNHGRLSYKKGLDVLIRAFAKVREQVPDCRLVLVGPDDEGIRAGLEALASELGIGSDVVFTGELAGARLANAIAAADVWALTSHTENFGIAVVEAMSAGKPTVISSAVNIARDAERAGATLEVDVDADAAASAIVRLLGDQELRHAIGRRARLFVERFDWGRVSDQYVSLYREVSAR